MKLLTVSFLQPPITSSLSYPNVLLTTMFSDTQNLCPSLNVRHQAARPYKTTGATKVFYILIFTFLHSTREDVRF
jgi:hypothetical protein